MLVRLTEAGRELVTRFAGLFEIDLERLLAPLDTAERRALTGAATAVLLAYAAEQGVNLGVTP